MLLVATILSFFASNFKAFSSHTGGIIDTKTKQINSLSVTMDAVDWVICMLVSFWSV
jgi:hypothetical protein